MNNINFIDLKTDLKYISKRYMLFVMKETGWSTTTYFRKMNSFSDLNRLERRFLLDAADTLILWFKRRYNLIKYIKYSHPLPEIIPNNLNNLLIEVSREWFINMRASLNWSLSTYRLKMDKNAFTEGEKTKMIHTTIDVLAKLQTYVDHFRKIYGQSNWPRHSYSQASYNIKM